MSTKKKKKWLFFRRERNLFRTKFFLQKKKKEFVFPTILYIGIHSFLLPSKHCLYLSTSYHMRHIVQNSLTDKKKYRFIISPPY